MTDRGYLVTLDNWGRTGHGKVIASYTPDGRLVASLSLADLFSDEEIRTFLRSVSSIMWRGSSEHSVREGQQSVLIPVQGEAQLIYELETGRWQICEDQGGVRRCRTKQEGREWGPFREPPLRR